jgi:hypothetical protein
MRGLLATLAKVAVGNAENEQNFFLHVGTVRFGHHAFAKLAPAVA